MEGEETPPQPPAPDNAAREEIQETEAAAGGGAPMSNSDEYEPWEYTMRQEISSLLEENGGPKEVFGKILDEAYFKDNNSNVESYTGVLSFKILMHMLDIILPDLQMTEGENVSHFQMLLMTLMRLKCGLSTHQLAYIFDLEPLPAARMVRRTLYVLYKKMGCLVHWPERHCLQATMPHQFVEMFGNRVTVIIDCLECAVDWMPNAKYLIGITPYGSISFISAAFKGWASNKQVAEKCGLLQKLSSGDLVLAPNSGFDIKESLALLGASLKAPAVTAADHSTLSAEEMEENRKMDYVRNQMDRVMRFMRSKFTVLNERVNMGFMLPFEEEEDDVIFWDAVVAVCCALTNMHPSVVNV